MTRYSFSRPIRQSRRLVQPFAFWTAFGLATVAAGLAGFACIYQTTLPGAVVLFALFGYLCHRSTS